MKYALAIVAAAGLASVANAATTINFESSIDNGATWASDVIAPAGSTVLVRMRVQLTGGATSMGLSGLTAQPVLSNWAAGDTRNGFTFPGVDNFGDNTTEAAYDGRMTRSEPQTNTGRIFPYGTSGQGAASSSGLLTSFVDGGNRLRFAGSRNITETTNPSWGLGVAQNPASLMGTNYSSSLNAVVFRYSITIDATPSLTDRVLSASIVQVSGGFVKWYQNSGGTQVFNDTALTIAPGSITVPAVPAPGALALLGLGGLVAARRRRA